MLHFWLDHGSMHSVSMLAVFGTVLSAMFHWHVMRNGAMRVGAESRTLLHDLRQMPRLAVTFVADPVRSAIATLRPRFITAEAEDLEVAA
jgi:hypothetical protein